eukprot:tig00001094_g6982.t1
MASFVTHVPAATARRSADVGFTSAHSQHRLAPSARLAPAHRILEGSSASWRSTRVFRAKHSDDSTRRHDWGFVPIAAVTVIVPEGFPKSDALIAKVIESIKFNKDGLVPAIAQQHDTGEVLMMAWMNAKSVEESLKKGRVCYWSRSRSNFWRKGESSGQVQYLKDLRVDCDGDTLLLSVDQVGVACHTGRRSCFYLGIDGEGFGAVEPVVVEPDQLYGKHD